jgi:hypothetical protein
MNDEVVPGSVAVGPPGPAGPPGPPGPAGPPGPPRHGFPVSRRTMGMVTDAQQACFEAGIKFGSLYHQFAGTPVSPASTRSLETAITESIENQPHCESVTVEIGDEAVAADIDHENGYTELSGHLMEVEMRIEYDGVTVRTRMEMEDGYPLMKLVAVESVED